jgi:hypothetical protein
MILGASMLPGAAGILGAFLPGPQRIPGGRVPEACGITGPLWLLGGNVLGVTQLLG